MVELTKERDLETLRQISLLLDRENQRLITKTLELTAEVARLRGLSDPTQLQLAILQELAQRRAQLFQPDARASSAAAAGPPRPPHAGHGPRPQPALRVVEIRHELPTDDRQCPACGGELMEMAGQAETSERITSVKLTYAVEHHVRQKYRCRCNGAVVTAPAPAQVLSGSRYAPEFGFESPTALIDAMEGSKRMSGRVAPSTDGGPNSPATVRLDRLGRDISDVRFRSESSQAGPVAGLADMLVFEPTNTTPEFSMAKDRFCKTARRPPSGEGLCRGGHEGQPQWLPVFF
jgi:zinc-finger binding domain of transposase IS66